MADEKHAYGVNLPYARVMVASLLQLALLLSPVLIFFIARSYLRMQAEQRLRDNPPPKRILEISLPTGVKDSNVRMQRFHRKNMSVANGDDKMRAAGLRQFDIVYFIDCPVDAVHPELRFLAYCDPDQMDKVKRLFQGTYVGAQINELKEDPMAAIAEAMRPPKPVEEPAAEKGLALASQGAQ